MHTGLSSGVARYRDFIALISQANIETIIAILLPGANDRRIEDVRIVESDAPRVSYEGLWRGREDGDVWIESARRQNGPRRLGNYFDTHAKELLARVERVRNGEIPFEATETLADG